MTTAGTGPKRLAKPEGTNMSKDGEPADGTARSAVPVEVAIVLVDGFQVSTLGLCIDPLERANAIRETELYRWITVGLHSRTVRASSGVHIVADTTIDALRQTAILIVCAARLDHRKTTIATLTPHLHRMRQAGTILAGVDNAATVLAGCGMVRGAKVTVAWTERDVLRTEHPEIVVARTVWVNDGDLATAGPGRAAADLVTSWIGRDHGSQIATQVYQELALGMPRGPTQLQTSTTGQRIGSSNPKMINAVELMEANIDEPLSIEEIAQLVGVSRRALQRSFKDQLNATPTEYYLSVRAGTARRLVRSSTRELAQISRDTGFSTATAFAKQYRKCFGTTPSEDRRAAERGVSPGA